MHQTRLHFLLAHRHERHSQRQKSLLARATAAGLSLLFVVAILLFAALFWLAGTYAELTKNLPSIQILPALLDSRDGLLLQPTEFYDRSGQTLIYRLENPGINRRYLLLDPQQKESLSPQLVQVVLAISDPQFWQHPGFDWNHLTEAQPATLAERLVYDLLMENEPEGWQRPLRMRLLATQVTQKFGRARVLEWYLNSANFGHLAYGAESAARLYLGKSASTLSLPEAALLAAALQAPALNPLDSPTACLERQQGILDALQQKGLISAEEREKARTFAFQPPLAPTTVQPLARAFSNLALEQLSKRLGRTRIERGGLKVITTLDLEQQTQLVCALQAQLARLQGSSQSVINACEAARLLPTLPANLKPLPAGLKGSAILLDPSSGQILALAGDSTATTESSAILAHDPGSLLTPFVALSSFASGFSPASLVWDIPDSTTTISQKSFRGPMRLRTALANDFLTPINRILQQIGSENVWRLAEPLGLTSLAISPSPASLLLEGGSATVLQLAQAYSVFATQGVLNGATGQAGSEQIQPVAVLSVQDQDGRLLLQNEQTKSSIILSQPLAYLVHNVLSDENARWLSLGYPNALEIGRPVGAKVGASQNGTQAWTAGYSPQRLAVIWLGLPADAPAGLALDVRGAAGIWHAVMQYASRNLPASGWTVPAGISSITVCDPSGLLPTKLCPALVTEVFLQGNEPTSVDNLYKLFKINRETNRLATVFTPLELVEERTFMVLPLDAQGWGKTAGLPLPPAEYDLIQPPNPSASVQISAPAAFSVIRGKVILRGTAAGEGFTSYRLRAGAGLNPSTWSQIGQESQSPIQNGILATWDTPNVSGLYAVQLQVIRQNSQVESAVIQVTVDNTPPTVRITAPQNGAKLPQGKSSIVLQAEVSDEVGIQRVEFWIDGALTGESRSAPYILLWLPNPGNHSLVVKAQDTAGNLRESQPVTFTVE